MDAMYDEVRGHRSRGPREEGDAPNPTGLSASCDEHTRHDPRFAERSGTKNRTLDNWLSPELSENRNMPDMAWKFVREVLENHTKNAWTK
jgi:hypothetical protein